MLFAQNAVQPSLFQQFRGGPKNVITGKLQYPRVAKILRLHNCLVGMYHIMG